MKNIAIYCYGYNELEHCFKMLKEIFSILNIQCVIYRTKREIITRGNTIYKFINTANPTYKNKICGICFEKNITAEEIEKQYDILRNKMYEILN